MNILLDKRFERTLDRIVSGEFDEASGSLLEAWTFDDEASRRQAEKALAARGVGARIRSAYKPLLHFFLEEADLSGLTRVDVAYPVHPLCPSDRFLLEAYPLTALLPGVDVRFGAEEAEAAGPTGEGEYPLSYTLRLLYSDGRSEEIRVLAPNREYVDHSGQSVVAPCGWLRRACRDGVFRDERLETDYEAMYTESLAVVSSHDWGAVEPFFEVLSLRASLPAEDRPLPVGQEAVSLKEALHEELYFSLLEVFQKRTGRPISDRTIRPGQVVPEIVGGAGPSLRIELRSLSSLEEPGAPLDLDTAEGPISAAQVAAELERIDGRPFFGKSYSDRVIRAKYRPGSDAGVLISGGQHANETTGVVGAIRAARELAKRPGAHFAVCPLENPDGYELHRRLCGENPRHMHHAARYTAQGNDLEYQEEGGLWEKAVRTEAERRTGARFHINLHGYASHEWTRPLSGYIPRGFPTWMIPHGFFLVLRYHSGWEGFARDLLERLTLRLASIPALLEFTRNQLELYSRYVKDPPFQIVNGFPCDLSLNEATTIPLRLITEYPDETIYGSAFAAGHTAQMEAVLAAYDEYQALTASGRAPGGRA